MNGDPILRSLIHHLIHYANLIGILRISVENLVSAQRLQPLQRLLQFEVRVLVYIMENFKA